MNEFDFRLAYLETITLYGELKRSGLIQHYETTIEQINFAVDEDGLNYDVSIRTKTISNTGAERIEVLFKPYLP